MDATADWALQAKAMNLDLADRFTIARGSWRFTRNVFVALSYGDQFGVGEASTSTRWAESPESVRRQLEQVDLGLLTSPFDLELLTYLLPAGAARCALDMALHDLAAKLAGITVSQLLGLGEDGRPSTSFTIPITTPDKMAARAIAYSDHPVLKVKVGFDGDVEAVRAVREVYEGVIRVDANEGWKLSEAISRLKQLEPLDIELCEQPIPAGHHDDLRLVSACTSIPIFADEDVCTSSDVASLAGVVAGVNLKLRKAGGIRETVRAIAVARAHGMRVMLGCDLESGIAATAGAHLAALVDHVDLDGPLLLTDDPFPGVSYKRGVMTLPGGPGLGIRRKPQWDSG